MSAVAGRYARAISELAAEAAAAGTASPGGPGGGTLVEEIERAAETYASSPDLQNALENPLMAYDAKRAVVSDISDRLGLSPVAKNTLLLLTERRRMRFLPEIARQLRTMGDLAQGVVHAEVTSAAPLSDAFYTRLQAQLERMTGKRVILDRRQDPTLIAGVVTRIGDTVYDGSLRARLDSMKTALLPN